MLETLLNHIEDAPFTCQGNYIPEAYRQYIKTLDRIGKYSDGEHTPTLAELEEAFNIETVTKEFFLKYLHGR